MLNSIKGGYVGFYLDVDLSERRYEVKPLIGLLKEEDLKSYVGGAGLAAKVLVNMENPKHIDPFGKGNTMVFATGPLTGVFPSSGRHVVAAKSPQTGIWGEASVGGTWGTELKKAGFDVIIVKGKSEVPVYLWIENGNVEIKDANDLWGLDTYETDAALKTTLHENIVVSCIGPAGENLVPISGIFTDGTDGRSASRCGLGAVMGSKKLKAIAVSGTGTIPLYDEDAVKKIARRIVSNAKEKSKTLSAYGTARSVLGAEQIGDLPIKNWLEGSWFEGAQKLSGESMAEKILSGKFSCSKCFIGCGRQVTVSEGQYGKVDGAGPEYETLASLGSLCLIDDLEAVVTGNDLCNRLGIDTISAGSAVAFAMEAYEEGLVTKEDFNGVEPLWGSTSAMLAILNLIGKGEAFGKVLGKGTRFAAQQLGDKAQDMAVESKGLEFPLHDPRAFTSLALGYATSNRGACHLQGVTHALESSRTVPEFDLDHTMDRFDYRGKGRMVAIMQNAMALFNASPVCILYYWCGMTLTDMCDALNAATGLGLKMEDLRKSGERVFTLKRLYNNACGVTSKDDSISTRILKVPRKTGGAADNLPNLEKMLKDYYQHRGWEVSGIPGKEKIEEMKLADEYSKLILSQ